MKNKCLAALLTLVLLLALLLSLPAAQSAAFIPYVTVKENTSLYEFYNDKFPKKYISDVGVVFGVVEQKADGPYMVGRIGEIPFGDGEPYHGFWVVLYTEKDGVKKYNEKIRPYTVLVTDVYLEPLTAELLPEGEVQLNAKVSPSYATNQSLKWTSSKPDIATVGPTGLVTGKAAGTAEIYVMTQDGSDMGSFCKVTVHPAPPKDFKYEKTPGGIRITSYTGSAAEVTVPGKIEGLPVTIIGEKTFYNMAGITKVVLPDSIKEIEFGAFAGMSGLGSINLPAGLHTLHNYVFSRCSSLTDISLPASLVNIGEFAFNECSSLTSLTLPDSVSKLGKEAFRLCTKMTRVKLSSGLTSLPNDLFIECESLNSIVLPDSITAIGERVFFGCTSLPSITLPAKLTSIARGAFYNCKSLTAITIPEGITKIPIRLFWKCWGLTSVTLPAGITEIGEEAFSECFVLKDFKIPQGITKIGFATFWGCKNLTSVALPEGLTEIGMRAFKKCAGLTTVAIPGKVGGIGEEAFKDCTALSRITIRANVAAFGVNVLQNSPVTIYGDVPSAAKDYADKNNIPFVDLALGIPGDANDDLEVDIQDLISLMDYLVKGSPCPSMMNADADGSGGKPDVKDFVWIVNRIVK